MSGDLKYNCQKLKKTFNEAIHLRRYFEQKFSELLEDTRDVLIARVLQKNLGEKVRSLREFFYNVPQDWQDFYQTEFGLDLSKTRIKIPEKKEGFNRLLAIAPGMTANKAYEACEKRFACKKMSGMPQNLDSVFYNQRDYRNGAYAIWVRDSQEADYELGTEVTADEMDNRHLFEGLDTETLTERLIHELKYWSETGDHLDIDSITLCSGTKMSDSDVPRVEFNIDKVMEVDYCSSRGSHYDVRPRQVIA